MDGWRDEQIDGSTDIQTDRQARGRQKDGQERNFSHVGVHALTCICCGLGLGLGGAHLQRFSARAWGTACGSSVSSASTTRCLR